MHFAWDWNFVAEIWPELLQGLRITILATFGATAVSLVLGLFWALTRRSRHAVVRAPVIGFTEFIRGTPLLVQLYFIFFVLPTVGVTLTPLTAGIIGLGLHYSTYTAEIYRAGIGAVPRGQWEAAMAIDLPRARVWRSIILPQAIPKVIPALGNTVIAMFKETALLSAITVQEVIGVAREIGTTTYLYTEPLIIASFYYLVISYTSSVLIRMYERRLAARTR
jgi:polar amino acid transport system permease protein